MFGCDAEGIGSALSGIARINALVTDLFVHIITGIIGLALRIVFTSIWVRTEPSEANGTRRAIECCRARSSDSIYLIFNACFSWWLTGIEWVANEPGWTNAMVASYDVDAIGACATRVALKTFINVFAVEERVSIKSSWTDALHTCRFFQTSGAFAARYGITSRNRCA